MRLRQGAINASYPLSIVAAFLIGFASFVIVTIARYHLVSSPEDATASQFLIELLFAGFICWGVARVLKFEEKMLKTSQFLGVMCSTTLLHNFAFWMPILSAAVISEHWVEKYHTYGVPNTFILGGYYVPFAITEETSIMLRERYEGENPGYWMLEEPSDFAGAKYVPNLVVEFSK